MKLLKKYIKLILNEQAFEKNKWELLSPNDERRKEIADELYGLVQQTYSYIGQHANVSSPEDLSRYAYWIINDLDDDPEPDVFIFGKPGTMGAKLGGAANDGSATAVAAYKQQGAHLRSGGAVGGIGNWWGEISGKPAYAMIRRGAPAVEDETLVRKLLQGKDIEWYGAHPDEKAPDVFKNVNGWYSRKLGADDHLKIILGKPL